MELPENGQQTLMLLYDRRARASAVRTRAFLCEHLSAFRQRAGVEPPLQALLDLGLVAPDGEDWRLTASGIAPAQVGWRALSIQGFDEALVRNYGSASYQRYCERVFLTGLHQLNMVDDVQLERAIERMALGPGERFVDLGCGVGTLTQHVRARTGAEGHGIDFAPNAIAEAVARCASDPGLRFTVGDLNALELLREYDVAVAFDTLYFVDDLRSALERVWQALRPGGRLVAFYTATRQEGEPVLEAHDTPLARAWAEMGVAWTAEEFSAEEHALWQRAQQACAELREAFEAEGQLKAWTSRDNESRRSLDEYDRGLSRRWLYVGRR